MLLCTRFQCSARVFVNFSRVFRLVFLFGKRDFELGVSNRAAEALGVAFQPHTVCLPPYGGPRSEVAADVALLLSNALYFFIL